MNRESDCPSFTLRVNIAHKSLSISILDNHGTSVEMTASTILVLEEHKIGEKYFYCFQFRLTRCTFPFHWNTLYTKGHSTRSGAKIMIVQAILMTKCDTTLLGYIYGLILSFPMPHSFA